MNNPSTTPISIPRRYPPAPLVGVGVVVFNAQGQALLIKRGNPPRAGQWSLPGGLIDLGEKLVDAARREIREECAIKIEIGDFVATFEPIERDAAGRIEYHYVVIDFWASHVSGEPVAQDDAAAATWVDIAALPALQLNAETHRVILLAYAAWQAKTKATAQA